MKRLALATGLLLLGFAAVAPARADFAVIKFNSGYCRVWTATEFGPQDGRYLWFKWRNHWHYRFYTAEGANRAMHRAVAWGRCQHWWG